MTAALIVLLASLISTNWSNLTATLRSGAVVYSNEPHVLDKKPRYLIDQVRRQELEGGGVEEGINL